MRNHIILALIATSLAACASRGAPAGYGNFVKGGVPADGKLMADDVTKKLAALYPPARTRLNLLHGTPDTFGRSLVGALRTKGYALSEFKTAPRDWGRRAPVPVKNPADEVALAYVVDQPLDASFYRVTVHINDQLLSRLYETKDGATAPAGYWVRKE